MNVSNDFITIRSGKSVFPLLVFPTSIVLAFLLLSDPHTAIIFVWFSLWSAGLAVFLLKFLGKQDIKRLFPYIFLGLTIRLIIAILFRIKNASTGGLITPDEYFYFNYSKEIAEAWKSGEHLGLMDIWHYVGTRNFGYHIWCALHFLILPEKLLPVISNIFLDIVTGSIIFKILKYDLNNKVGKFSFVFWMINPLVIFWSVFLLKDTLLVNLIVSTVFCFYKILRHAKNIIYYFIFVCLILTLTTLRFYLPVVLIPLLLLNFYMEKKIKKWSGIFSLTILLLLLVCFLLRFSLSNSLISWFREEGLKNIILSQYHKSAYNALLSSYSFKVSNASVESFLLSSIAYLLYPSPLNVRYIFNFTGKLSGLFFLLGTIFWYVLIAYSIIGTFYVIRKHQRFYFFSIFFSLSLAILYGFLPAEIEPRHRLMIIPFITILASVGIVNNISNKKLSFTFSLILIFLISIIMF